jgi:beta-barrel assembly-enhancing protease
MNSRPKYLTYQIFVLIICLFSPCQAFSFSVSEEKEVGEKLLIMVRQEFALVDSPDIVQYINRLGGEIQKTTGSEYFDCKFFIIKDENFNAFAAPSGMIFIYSGLIETMNNENELVSVLAHEVGHTVGRHLARQARKNTRTQIATMMLAIAGIALGGDLGNAALAGSLATQETMRLKYSREDEEEADRLALKWMLAQKRNPQAMVNMLRTMRRVSRYQQANVPTYLLTHPEPGVRMGYISDLISTRGKEVEYPEPDNFEFLRAKYRILAMVKSSTLLPLLNNKASKDNKKVQSFSDAMILYGISQIHLANGDFEKSKSYLLRVIKTLPQYPILKTDLAIINFLSGDHASAMQLLKNTVRKRPDCAYTAYHLAKVYQESGVSEMAEKEYLRLFTLLPDYARPYFQVARLESIMGDQGTSHYYLGLHHWYHGKPDLSSFHLKKAVALLPVNNNDSIEARKLLKKIIFLKKSEE